MTTKEMIAVMQAYEEGKQIQFRNENNEWEDITSRPEWNWKFNDYRIKPEEEKPKRMTNRQLAEWLANGKGECTFRGKRALVLTCWTYDREEPDLPVEEEVVIRPWGSDEWIEPTVDIYERDCKGVKNE